MITRRLTIALAAAALVALSSGTAAAATKPPTRPTTVPVHATKPAHPAKPAAPAAATCRREVADDARVMPRAALDALTADAVDLAGQTTLRIRTVTSVPGGNLNAYEKSLQIRCGWADAANVRQPRLLVVMVATKDRQMGIYPGPDLVGTITEQAWLSIEQQSMRPLFAGGDWSGGLKAGVDALDNLLTGGNPTPSGARARARSRSAAWSPSRLWPPVWR